VTSSASEFDEDESWEFESESDEVDDEEIESD
jgi:hypothetical protein